MKLLRRADNLITAYHWANLLQAAGIRCEVRNTALTGALGDIPFLEAAPQLWVFNDLEPMAGATSGALAPSQAGRGPSS